jgi:hypothetical protein
MNPVRWLSLSALALTASCRDGILLGGDAGESFSPPTFDAQKLDPSAMPDVAIGGSTCWSAGQTYAPGVSVPTALGVPIACTCTASGVQCTPPVVDVDAAAPDTPSNSPGAPSCVYYGEAYAQNTSVPSGDGNTTCCCLDGSVICLASLAGAPTCVTDGLVGGQPGGIPGNPNFYTCAAGSNDRSVFVPSMQGSGYVCDGYVPAGGDGGL